MKTLLKGYELVKMGPVSPNFPLNKVANLLKANEYAIFDNTDLTVDLYTSLLDKMTDIPASTGVWSSSKTYATGDTVLYYGSLLKSKVDDNNLDPAMDDDEDSWETVDKFTEPCLNELWCLLGPFLAYKIVGDNVTMFTYEIGGKGTLKYSEEFRQQTSGQITVERGERFDLQNAILKQAEVMYSAVVSFIKSNGESCTTLQASKPLCFSKDVAVKIRSRRVAFLKNTK